MSNAVLPDETGMAALIGNDVRTVQEIIDDNNLDLEIANDNSNIQTVISGKLDNHFPLNISLTLYPQYI